MAWLILIVAGLIETGWAVGLKYSDGFTRFWPSLLTIAGIGISMFMLAISARSIHIGTAYPVWVGVGAAGAVVMGILIFGEPATPARMLFLALLMTSIVGLMATAH